MKLKHQSDKSEEKERLDMEQSQATAFARREAKFRQQQQAELQALLKRIECRRKEHIKQMNLDSKRLLQRNRNVQSVLESKQAAEAQRLFAEIKKNLATNSFGTAPPVQSASNNKLGGKSSASNNIKSSDYQQQNRINDSRDDEPFEPAFMTSNGPSFNFGEDN